jgi:hypothetical protein
MLSCLLSPMLQWLLPNVLGGTTPPPPQILTHSQNDDPYHYMTATYIRGSIYTFMQSEPYSEITFY